MQKETRQSGLHLERVNPSSVKARAAFDEEGRKMTLEQPSEFAPKKTHE
jgi:hypothetical protein